MSFLEPLISVGDAWLRWALGAAQLSLLVFLVLLVMRPLLRRWVSSHAASWFWLLPLIPLVTPPLLPSVLPFDPRMTPDLGALSTRQPAQTPEESLLPPAPGESYSSQASAHHLGQASDAVALQSGSTSSVAATSKALPWRTLAVLAWWTLSLGLGTLALRQPFRLKRLLAQSHPPSRELRARFSKLAKQMAPGQTVHLRCHEDLASPATTGFLRATVWLPEDLAQSLDPDALDWILRHELAHVRRRDVWVQALTRAVRILWPFHPVAWWSPSFAERERELACDEAALFRAPKGTGPSAAKALLTVIQRCQQTPVSTPLGVSFLHPPTLEKKRIMKRLDDNQPTQKGMSRLASVLLIGTGLGLIPVAASARSKTQSAPQESTPAVTKPDATENYQKRNVSGTVTGALRYLMSTQRPDGSWPADTKGKKDMAGEFNHYGVTGLVLMTLLEAPEGAELEGRKEAIQSGLRYLSQSQDAKHGLFNGGTIDMLTVPSHAMATRAWIRAHVQGFGHGDTYDWKVIAKNALDGLASAKNPYSGWRYDVPAVGDADSVITSLALLAIAEAKNADLPFTDENRFTGFDYLSQVFTAESGHYGYNKKGGATSRLAKKADSFPGEKVELPTAICLLTHLTWEEKPVDLLKSAGLLIGKTPHWSLEDGTTDSYYWAFGTQAIQPFGGLLTESWNTALVEALIPNATIDSKGLVSWPALDAWHVPGNEVAMTAMCTWALQSMK